MASASVRNGLGGGQTVESVKFSQETMDWLASQRKKVGHVRGTVFTPEIDEKILAGWDVMSKADLAEALGMCEGVIRRRYRELTKGAE